MTASVKALEALLLDWGDVSDVSDVDSYFEGFMVKFGCFVIHFSKKHM